MNILLKIVSLILFVGVIYLSYANKSLSIDMSLIGNINVALLLILVLSFGILIGVSWISQFYLIQKNKLNSYKRELEKSSISDSSSKSRVEVLEAKIATLEKALDDALNK